MDPFDLARFRSAQAGVYERAAAELRAGKKRGHWMWFMFPQMRGLGASEMANFYGMSSRAEAEAYAADPVLGPRLVALFAATLAHAELTARDIFGSPDDVKFGSCATLFAATSAPAPVFVAAIDRFFEGRRDPRTLALLGEDP